MSSVNTGRVIGAGLLAGAVFNVVDFTWQATVLKADWAVMVDQLHLNPAVGDMTLANALPWIVVDFVMGILTVLNYAAMRPRFGPGPKTALLAGFILYGGITVILYGFTSMGIFSQALFVKNAACTAVTVALGSLAGGWAYKEN